MTKKVKKLVIGLRQVPGVEQSVGWLDQLPSVGNYHETFIYLPSLDEERLKKLLEIDPAFLNDLKKDIFEALLAGLNIFVVSAPEIEIGDSSSYDFLPFSIERVEKRVETFEEEKTTGYLSSVKLTTGYFEQGVGSTYLLSRVPDEENTRYRWKILPFWRTLTKKPVSFMVELREQTKSRRAGYTTWVGKDVLGSVLIVPPTTEISPDEGFIRFIQGKERKTSYPPIPDWFNKIELPGEEELEGEIKEARKKKKQVKEQLSKLESDLEEKQDLKWLLRLKGEALEEVVERAFQFLGLEILEGEEGEEDRVLKKGENTIPVEIKGHKQAVRRSDLRQVVDRTSKAKNSDGETKGLLVANPFCEEEPDKRPKSFDDKYDKVVSGAESFDVALLDTITLLELVKSKMAGEKGVGQQLEEKLFTEIGTISFRGQQGREVFVNKE